MISRVAVLAWLVAAIVACSTEARSEEPKPETDPAASAASTPDPANLDGAWEVTFAQLGANEVPVEDLRRGIRDNQLFFEFGNLKFELALEGRNVEVPFTLETEKEPFAIDIKDENSDAMRKGIFRIKGDELELCIALDTKMKRPVDFAIEEGETLVIYMKLQRVK
jgi:uncharacterized protein (TIGR03067 family)